MATWQQTGTNTTTGPPDWTGLNCDSTTLGTNALQKFCDQEGSGGGAVTVTLPAKQSYTAAIWVADAALGVTSIPAGTWNVKVNVTSGASSGSQIQEVHICRLNSSGVSQATICSSTGLTIDAAATGVKSIDVTQGSSHACSSTDRFSVQVVVYSNSHGGTTIGITSDQLISDTIPITISCVTDAVTVTDYNAVISNDISFTANSDAVTVTGYNCSIPWPVQVDCQVDAVVVTDLNVGINAEVFVGVGTDTTTVTGYDVNLPLKIPDTPSVTVTEYNADITAPGEAVQVDCQVDAVTVTEFGAQIPTKVNCGADAVTVTGLNPTIKVFELEQVSFRWRKDNGSETTAEWLAAANANPALMWGHVTYRIRFLLKNIGGQAGGSGMTFACHFRLNAGTWYALSGPAGNGVLWGQSDMVDNGDTTQQIGSGSFLANNDGQVEKHAWTLPADIPADGEVEVEFAMCFGSGSNDGDTVEFRVKHSDGTDLKTYTNTPTTEAEQPAAKRYKIIAWRWRDDDDDEANATWLAPVNTPISLPIDTTVRVRIAFQEQYGLWQSGGAAGLWGFRADFDGAGEQWIYTTSNKIRLTDSQLVNGGDTTQQITAGGDFPADNNAQADTGNNRYLCVAGGGDDPHVGSEIYESEISFQLRSVDGAQQGEEVRVWFNYEANESQWRSNMDWDTCGRPWGIIDGVIADTDAVTITEYNATIPWGEVTVDCQVDAVTVTDYNVGINAEVTVNCTSDAVVVTDHNATVTFDETIHTASDAVIVTDYNAGVNAGTGVLCGSDAVTVTEYNATITFDETIHTTSDTVTVTEYNATVEVGLIVNCTVDAVTVTDYNAAISFDETIHAASDAVIVTDYNAAVSADTGVLCDADAVTVTGYNVGCSLPIGVDADAVTITGYNANISAGSEIGCSVDAVTVTGYNATVSAGVEIACASDAVVVTEYNATVTFDETIHADSDAVVVTEYNAAIAFDLGIGATSDTVTVSGLNAGIAADVNIAAGSDAVTVTDFNCGIAADQTIGCAVDAVVVTAYNTTISAPVTISCVVDAVTVTGHNADVEEGGFALEQVSYRWRKDEGDETGATWLAAANTAPTNFYPSVVYRLRFLLKNIGSETGGASEIYALWWRRNAGAWTELSEPNPEIQWARSLLSQGSDTTQQLGSGSFVTNNDGQLTTAAWTIPENIPVDGEIEVEFSLVLSRYDQVSDGDTFDFQIRKSSTGELLDTYTNSPSVTLDKPAYPRWKILGYRWRNDDGTEATATWKHDLNHPASIPLDANSRLRIAFQELYGCWQSGWDGARAGIGLQKSLNGGPYSWCYPATSTVCKISSTSQLVHGDDCLQRISSGDFVSDNNSQWENSNDRYFEDQDGGDIQELEVSIMPLSDGTARGDQLTFRLMWEPSAPQWRGAMSADYTATAGVDWVIQNSTAAVTITEYNCSVDHPTIVNCVTDTASLTGLNAVVEAGQTANCVTDSVTVTALQAVVSSANVINATLDAATITSLNGDVEAGFGIPATSDAVTVTTYQAHIASANVITADVASVTVQEHNALIPVFELTQTDYRWRKDNGTETTAEWLAAAHTAPATVYPAVTYRLRVGLRNTGGLAGGSGAELALYYRVNAGTWTQLAGPSGSPEVIWNRSDMTAGGDTTQQLTAGSYATDNDGQIENSTWTLPNNIPANYDIEVEFAFSLSYGQVNDGDTIEFRVQYADAALLGGGYTYTPSIEVTKPAYQRFELIGYRWRTDDGDEATATWYANTNAPIDLPLDTPVRLRMAFQEKYGCWISNGAQGSFGLWRSYNGGASTWVYTSSTQVAKVVASQLTQGGDCVQRISSGDFVTDNDGQNESSNGRPLREQTGNAIQETEWSIQLLSSECSQGDYISFSVPYEISEPLWMSTMTNTVEPFTGVEWTFQRTSKLTKITGKDPALTVPQPVFCAVDSVTATGIKASVSGLIGCSSDTATLTGLDVGIGANGVIYVDAETASVAVTGYESHVNSFKIECQTGTVTATGHGISIPVPTNIAAIAVTAHKGGISNYVDVENVGEVTLAGNNCAVNPKVYYMHAQGTAAWQDATGPWNNPAECMSQSEYENNSNLLPGDTLYISSHGGVYRRNTLGFPNSGAPGLWIKHLRHPEDTGIPHFTGAYDCTTGWVYDAANVWYRTMSSPPHHLFFDRTLGDPSCFGQRKQYLSDLAQNKDWFWDGGTDTAYLYCDNLSGPDVEWSLIEGGTQKAINFGTGPIGPDWIWVEGIAASCGLWASVQSNARNIGCVFRHNIVEWAWQGAGINVGAHQNLGDNRENFAGPSKWWLIEWNIVRYNVNQGIAYGYEAQDGLVQYNHCYENDYYQVLPHRFDYWQQWGGGIKCFDSTNDPDNPGAGYHRGNIVQFNYLHNNGAGGEAVDSVWPRGNGSGFWWDASQALPNHRNIARYNWIEDNSGCGIFIEITSYNDAYGNVCINNAKNGSRAPANIVLDDRNGDRVTRYNRVYNNTCVGGFTGLYMDTYNAPEPVTADLAYNQVINNIFVGNEDYECRLSHGGANNASMGGHDNLVSRNCFGVEHPGEYKFQYKPTGWPVYYYVTYDEMIAGIQTFLGVPGQEATFPDNCIEADPEFVNPLTGNYSLHGDSACIDVGLDLGESFKMALDARSRWTADEIDVQTLDQNAHGSGWDLGAYVHFEFEKGIITLTGYPAVRHEHVVIVDDGAVAVTGHNPTIYVDVTAWTNTAAVTVTPYNPYVAPVIQIDAASEAVTVTDFNVAVGVGNEVYCNRGVVTIDGYGVLLGTAINCGTDSVAITEYNCGITNYPFARCNTGAVSVAPYGVRVNARVVVSAATAAVNLTGQGVSVNAEVALTTALATVTATGHGINHVTSAKIDAVTLTDYNATVTPKSGIPAQCGTVTVTGYNVLVQVLQEISCRNAWVKCNHPIYDHTVWVQAGVRIRTKYPKWVHCWSDYEATLNIAVGVMAQTDTVTISGHNASVTIHPQVIASPGAVTITAYKPRVSAIGVDDCTHQVLSDIVTLTGHHYLVTYSAKHDVESPEIELAAYPDAFPLTEYFPLDNYYTLAPVMRLPLRPEDSEELLDYIRELHDILQEHYIPQSDRIENMIMVGETRRRPDPKGMRQYYFDENRRTLYLDCMSRETNEPTWISLGGTATERELIPDEWETLHVLTLAVGDVGGTRTEYSVRAIGASAYSAETSEISMSAFRESGTLVHSAQKASAANASTGGTSMSITYQTLSVGDDKVALQVKATFTGYTPDSVHIRYQVWQSDDTQELIL